MDDQNKNLIIATALSFVVILVWFVLFPPPEPQAPLEGTEISQTAPADGAVLTPSADVPAASTSTAATTSDPAAPSALETTPRVPIQTERVSGSLSLLGGRIDELSSQ